MDYRGLKKSTIKNKYSFPLFDELVDQLNRAKKFLKMC